MANVDYRVVDGELVEVTETKTTGDELRAKLQAAADADQDRLNLANEAKTQADAALVEATERVDAANAEVEAAGVAVQFSATRLSELDDTIKLLSEVDEPTDAEAGAEGTTEAVEVPVHTAEVAPA